MPEQWEPVTIKWTLAHYAPPQTKLTAHGSDT